MSLTPSATSITPKRKTPPTSPLEEESCNRGTRRSTTSAPAEKKRTRTGCNICRERHLKCDEGKPHCSQCIKRKRTGECNYGLQLKFSKFLDVRQPPFLCPVSGLYKIQDESMLIASEYVGGEEQYAALKQSQNEVENSPRSKRQSLRTKGGGISIRKDHAHAVDSPLQSSSSIRSRVHQFAHYSPSENSPHTLTGSSSAMRSSTNDMPMSNHSQDYRPIDDPIDQHFMEVFVEEMASWMDTMNAISYFSGNLPYESTTQPMLYNAFLACGAAHQFMVYPEQWPDTHHKNYWNKAITLFQEARDTSQKGDASIDKDLLAKTSVVLAVYSTLVDGVELRRDSLTRGFRLVSEVGWRQTSINSEGACYWLLRGMELLTSLNFRVRDSVPEHLDDADLGFNFDGKREALFNMESLWARKIIGIVTKIINETKHDPNNRSTPLPINQWITLSNLINGWHDSVPRTMLPLLKSAARPRSDPPDSFLNQSTFPKIYYQNMASTFAAIIYHTGWLILLQYHPTPMSRSESHQLQMHQLNHSRSICGIAKHVRSRPLASVILRPCLMAAEHLQDFDEQDEALAMLEDFKRQTGWQIGKLIEKLHDITWQRSNLAGPQSNMPLQQAVPITTSQLDSAILQQLGISQTIQNAQMHMYSTAPASQSILQSLFSNNYGVTTAQGVSQTNTFQEASQFMIPSAVITNTKSNRRSTMSNIPNYTTAAYGTHPQFAPTSATNQASFMQMTTDDVFPPSYRY